MRTQYLPFRKVASALLTLVLATAGTQTLEAQQHVIVNKDQTRPEQTQPAFPSALSKMEVVRQNGYNEIYFSAANESDVRRYIVEYSANGTDFQTGPDALPGVGGYSVKHYTNDGHPLLYRVRTELTNGKSVQSELVQLEGIDRSPIKVFPTVITGNVVNINATWPVQRVNIVNSSGAMVAGKDVNSRMDLITMPLPELAKGMYWVNVVGNGWKRTEKILVN